MKYVRFVEIQYGCSMKWLQFCFPFGHVVFNVLPCSIEFILFCYNYIIKPWLPCKWYIVFFAKIVTDCLNWRMTNANDPFLGKMEDIYSDVCCALDVQRAGVTEYDEERTFCETSE